MTKQNYLDYKLNGIIAESERLDLLTMGRGEGPECYCYPNLIVRQFTDTLAKNYAYVVMDNEAGMEHLSRRTTQNVDELLLISNHSVKGLRAISRIRELVSELKLGVKRQSVIINFAPAKLDTLVIEELNRLEVNLAATIPLDQEIYDYDLKLKPISDLPESSKAVIAIGTFLNKIL
jgi:CO dehydrogenase maturation factor